MAKYIVIMAFAAVISTNAVFANQTNDKCKKKSVNMTSVEDSCTSCGKKKGGNDQ